MAGIEGRKIDRPRFSDWQLIQLHFLRTSQPGKQYRVPFIAGIMRSQNCLRTEESFLVFNRFHLRSAAAFTGVDLRPQVVLVLPMTYLISFTAS